MLSPLEHLLLVQASMFLGFFSLVAIAYLFFNAVVSKN